MEVIEFIITVVSAAYGLYQWLRNRLRQKRITDIVFPPVIAKEANQAALVIDLTANDVKTMIMQIKNSIPRQRKMKVLTDNLIKTSPLSSEVFAALGEGSSFQCGCSERFVTVTTPNRMPEDTQGAKKYIESLNSVLSDTFTVLKKYGITTLHVFYHGPVPIIAYLGAKCADQFKVYYYHYSNGTYYLLTSDEVVN